MQISLFLQDRFGFKHCPVFDHFFHVFFCHLATLVFKHPSFHCLCFDGLGQLNEEKRWRRIIIYKVLVSNDIAHHICRLVNSTGNDFAGDFEITSRSSAENIVINSLLIDF